MVAVGLIESEHHRLSGGTCFSWLHALDLNRFNITLRRNVQHSGWVPHGTRPGGDVDVWMVRLATFLEATGEVADQPPVRSASRRREPQPVVVVCGLSEEGMGDALAAGVSGVVLDHDSPWNLAAAIHSAFDRRLFVSPAIMTNLRDQLAELMRPSDCQRLDELTEREHDVLICIARGLSNSAIARELHITHSTVGSHVLRILRKLDVANRTEAAAIAHRVGLTGLTQVNRVPLRPTPMDGVAVSQAMNRVPMNDIAG
ncbi:regulatory protein, luxR family [Amycolatopsis arida]|uniref:Regulatory protein, luxR family n=1 Tax=Amycolatopsis arida TaxID=587909 RepID=A0A1I5YFK2_9PSEU|nr:response regulator transcription factor [Amycolatopsis arida]TDX90481.1 regulatory LuxR family protein [Amycolatopsis arida]SFQ43011.1 regulatory protein, luxR family [Amycolatopsis arida]